MASTTRGPSSPYIRTPTLAVSPGHLLLALALTAWLFPALRSLALGYWGTAQGSAGPILLAVAGWALALQVRRRWHDRRRGSFAVALCGLILATGGYALGRMTAIMILEWSAVVAGAVALLYGVAGARITRACWVPIGLLLCLAPPPYTVSLALTGGLKLAIARWSVDVLHAAGFAVANSGSMLYIDGYELVVEAACSGLNALFSLLAIGFFYTCFDRRDDWGWAALLMMCLVPIAVAANLVRVVLLLLLVRGAGTGALDSALHPAAGLATFAASLAVLVGLDTLRRRWRRR